MDQKDGANVRIFPPLVPLAVIFAGAGLERLWPLDLGFGVSAPLRYWIGGLVVLGSTVGLGGWSLLVFRRGGQNPLPWKPTPRIEDRGPFAISRNPMYLELMLICVGVAVASMNWWILLLTPLAGWLLQRLAILPEEEYLERKFGDEYRAYKARVRRWI